MDNTQTLMTWTSLKGERMKTKRFTAIVNDCVIGNFAAINSRFAYSLLAKSFRSVPVGIRFDLFRGAVKLTLYNHDTQKGCTLTLSEWSNLFWQTYPNNRADHRELNQCEKEFRYEFDIPADGSIPQEQTH